MKQIIFQLKKLLKSRVLWFVVGLAFIPLSKYFRNKFIAHRDYLLVAKPEDFQSGLTHDDLGFLLNCCCQIFDDVALGLGVAPIHEFSCEQDLMNLIATLVNEQDVEP